MPARLFGVQKIDYMVVSHYDGDHVGGVPPLVAKVPVVTFVDHGANVQMTPSTIKNVDAYMALPRRPNTLS